VDRSASGIRLDLNIAGRKKNGILQRGAESDAAMKRLAEELPQLRDPESGRQVVEVVSPTHAELDPDRIVGYVRNLSRILADSGSAPTSVIEDNTDACINPDDVPVCCSAIGRSDAPSSRGSVLTARYMMVPCSPSRSIRN
jgi:predicted AlkP superfamily phosphohydrolase/phosphomutase